MTEVQPGDLKANGLLEQFESSSNQPEISNAAANTAATISNSEISQLKQQAPDLDVQSINKPVQPPEPPVPPATEASLPTNDVALHTSGATPDQLYETKVNGHEPATAENGISQPINGSLTESFVPSSIPSEIQSSNTTTDIPMPTEPLSEPAPLPYQAPASDLRTVPHSDALAPEAVATVETQKHEIYNQADAVQREPLDPAPAETSTVTVAPISTEKEIGLQTPQSPSDAPDARTTIPPTQPEDITSTPSIEKLELDVPGEQPADPAPSPVATTAEPSQDHEMTDAPAPTPPPVQKPVHKREEDNESGEPLAKRVKTDEGRSLPEQSSFKIPESPAPAHAAETPADAPSDQIAPEDVVTGPRLQHMKKVISNLKKSNASKHFRLPVDWKQLNIPTYPQIVTHPMDLGTIDTRLKHNEYKSVQAFRSDFDLIIGNCLAFNGPDHIVTQDSKKMQASFNNQMGQLPPVSEAEPSKADKKLKSLKVETPPPRATSAQRRQSVTKAASPKAPSPATFAPDPNGMPLIRRDSAVDGRPKRQIIPTKRNSDFAGGRPKKKKYELELRFCDEVLKTLSSPKHWAINQYFTHPVDPVALNIPSYFKIIKKPMDLGTLRSKLDSSIYERARDFEEDVRLIFKNCFTFNQPGDYVYTRGQELQKLFDEQWAKKDDWITAREPDSEPASVGGDDDEESEEDAESDEEAAHPQMDQIQQLQAQIEALKNQMTKKKKKKSSPGAVSKSSDKKKPKKEQPTSKFPGLQQQAPSKPKKSAKKAKPEKDRYVTFAEKQYISNGIAMLPERPMQEALKIIQNSVPSLGNSDQGEIELDIEEVPNHALLKLLSFVKKYAGPPPEEQKEEVYAAQGVSKGNKKGKSMSKSAQEAQIAELKGQLNQYQEGVSPGAVDSIETGAEDSDDDDDGSAEESEEE